MIPGPRLVGVKSTLERTKAPALVCHRKPDGDAIGSTLGLGLTLEALGATVQFVCVDPIPGHYRFLSGTDRFRTTVDAAQADTLVTLDCGADHLTGLDEATRKAVGPLVDIDHHPKHGHPSSPRLGVYDSTASSTAEIVYEIIIAAKWPLSRAAATALLTGVVADTAGFQNANTTARTMRVAARLLQAGARLKDIVKHCFYSSSIPKLRLWGTAMSRIEQNAKTAGIVSTVLTQDDIRECGAHPDDVEGLVNFLNAIPGVPATMLLTDMQQGEIKGSLRTRHAGINVAKLASLLGGGGHAQAAGFSVPGRLNKNLDDSWEVLDQPESLAD